jgi:hypothetical protein
MLDMKLHSRQIEGDLTVFFRSTVQVQSVASPGTTAQLPTLAFEILEPNPPKNLQGQQLQTPLVLGTLTSILPRGQQFLKRGKVCENPGEDIWQ